MVLRVGPGQVRVDVGQTVQEQAGRLALVGRPLRTETRPGVGKHGRLARRQRLLLNRRRGVAELGPQAPHPAFRRRAGLLAQVVEGGQVLQVQQGAGRRIGKRQVQQAAGQPRLAGMHRAARGFGSPCASRG